MPSRWGLLWHELGRAVARSIVLQISFNCVWILQQNGRANPILCFITPQIPNSLSICLSHRLVDIEPYIMGPKSIRVHSRSTGSITISSIEPSTLFTDTKNDQATSIHLRYSCFLGGRRSFPTMFTFTIGSGSERNGGLAAGIISEGGRALRGYRQLLVWYFHNRSLLHGLDPSFTRWESPFHLSTSTSRRCTGGWHWMFARTSWRWIFFIGDSLLCGADLDITFGYYMMP